ncbi:MAG: M15 family metallopeptidase [Syntrophomonadaceae bacterium]|jgi:hypothetical protein|nr:M15 family metallopeptidase [Syntrophomonadaceae bacterium]
MKKNIFNMIKVLAALFIAAGGILYSVRAAAGGNRETAPAASEAVNGELPPESFAPELIPGAGAPGFRETRALAEAYPGRIAERSFRDGDWALRIDDSWYFWANGRMMPEAERSRWKEFTGLRFYNYPRGLPPVPQLDEQTKARLRDRLAADRENPPARNEAFLSHLLEAPTREAAESQLVRVTLMGFPVRLHKLAAEKLELVDRDLKILVQTDGEVRRFLEGISHLGGFYWRPIAGTASRSYHGYGLALDFMAKDWGGKPYYWRNIMTRDKNWFELPYEKRWMAPLALIEVFEKHSFIWGGKWLYFDTVHFEYRPELFLLNPRA